MVRYFLMKAITWGQDGDFSYETMVTTYNNDSGGFGNLLSRTTAMINTYAGVIPGIGDVEPLDRDRALVHGCKAMTLLWKS